MYQYSRAIYRSIKDLIDPYADRETQLEYRREVLSACEADDGAARGGSALLLEARQGPLPGHPPLLPDHGAGPSRLGGDRGSRPRRVASSRSRSRPVRSTAASPAAARRRARASRASARRCPSASTAPRTSTSSAARSRRSSRGLDPSRSTGDQLGSPPGDPRHRQADPPAFAGRLPDGGAAAADRARRQVQRRGLLRRCPTRRSPAASTRTARSCIGARRPARLAARRVHRRGAVHAALRALLPARARARRRRARGAADVLLPARGPVRVRGAAAARAPEPRARPLAGAS